MKKSRGYIAIVLAFVLTLSLGGVALAAGVFPTSESGNSEGDTVVDFPASYRSEEAVQSGSAVLPPDENSPAAAKSIGAPYALSTSLSYYYVSGATLHSRDSSAGYAYEGSGCMYATSANTILITELHLPTGSVIKYLRLDYFDNSGTGIVKGFLTKYQMGHESVDVAGVASTDVFSGGAGSVVSLELNEVVDNENFAYALIGIPSAAGNSLRVCGLRVAYYAPTGSVNFLPSISK